MANAINTLAGVINFNDNNVDPAQVSDLLQDTPLLSALNAKAASNGTQHKYLKETVASSAAFRAVNAGLTKTYSQDELITATLQIIDAGFDFDKALLMGSVREDILAKELARSLRGAFVGMEKQVIYGDTALGDSAGFKGLLNSTALDNTDDTMVVAAGTAGDGVNLQTSVYLIRTGDDDISVVIGENGQIEIGDPYEFKKVADVTADNKSYDAVGCSVLGYGGLQYGSTYSAARVCNIQTVLDDDDIYNALSLFPAGRQPNVIAMNRTALKFLRDSRTATNQTGTPAPRPTEVEGIPIVVSDQIVSTEAVVVDA
jgi:hypothetical protein